MLLGAYSAIPEVKVLVDFNTSDGTKNFKRNISQKKKKKENKCWQGCGEIRNLVLCWQECIMAQPLQKRVWQFLKKLSIELPYNPAILLLGIYPRESKAETQGDTCTPILKVALFTAANGWK